MPQDDNDSKPADKNNSTFFDAEKIRQQLNALPIQESLEDKNEKKRLSSNQDAAKGLAASMQIVSGVIVGGLLGYGFDYLAGTLPFGTVIMIPIGMIAGFRNMIKMLDNDKQKS